MRNYILSSNLSLIVRLVTRVTSSFNSSAVLMEDDSRKWRRPRRKSPYEWAGT